MEINIRLLIFMMIFMKSPNHLHQSDDDDDDDDDEKYQNINDDVV